MAVCQYRCQGRVTAQSGRRSGRQVKSHHSARKGARALKRDICSRAVTLYKVGEHREDPWRRIDNNSYRPGRTIIATYRAYRCYYVSYCLWLICRVNKLISNDMIVRQSAYRCGKSCNTSCGSNNVLKADISTGEGARALQKYVRYSAVALFSTCRYRKDPRSRVNPYGFRNRNPLTAACKE